MVRLVFRPYTQIWRTICTSVPMQASIRVSPDFTFPRHGSQSLGSKHFSNSNLSWSRGWLLVHISQQSCLLRKWLHTNKLAHVLDSLVRVSRRVKGNRCTNQWTPLHAVDKDKQQQCIRSQCKCHSQTSSFTCREIPNASKYWHLALMLVT